MFQIHKLFYGVWMCKSLLISSTELIRDKWNYTAIMYALRDFYYPGFFICLLAGHNCPEIAHMAAVKNNVWALKLINTLGYNLRIKNN